MKHAISLLLALALLIGGLVTAERRHAQALASAQSILYLVADSERDLTRLPSRFTRIPDAQEIALGNALANLEVRKKLTADDQEIETYIAGVGARVATHAQRRLPFRFHYVPDRSFVNAFALPGGHVFLCAGLLEEMTTEDELAAVLAHEVEHIDHYHCAERLQTEAALRKIPLGAVLRIPVAVFQAGYSKEQELEADREGVLLAARSGYSAAGALRIFEIFDQVNRQIEAARTPQEEAVRVASDVVGGYFRSHPQMPERIAQVRTMIARQPELAARAEQPLGVEHIVLGWKSLDAVTDENFALAAELATRALRMHPGHPAAMQALCEADYGLGRDAAAADVYRQLVARDASAADAAEKWGEERAVTLAKAKEYEREIALVESLLTVQPAQPRLLHLAAWAYAMKGDDAAAAAKAMTITRLYMETAPQLAGNTATAATELLAANNFAQAASMARLALDLDGKNTLAPQTLGNAEFSQAHFDRAADAYKRMFDPDTADAAWLQATSDALGAARPATAAAELEAFLSSHSPTSLVDAARVETAGLALLSGNDAPAREVRQLVDRGSLAPEFLARLGWWYLRAHRPADAGAVLEKARSLRPGDAEVQNALAWTMLEEGKAPSAVPASTPDAQVRDALLAWQSGRKADALRQWSAAAQSRPQWLNPAWRAALYPPRVNALAQQLDAERAKRVRL